MRKNYFLPNFEVADEGQITINGTTYHITTTQDQNGKGKASSYKIPSWLADMLPSLANLFDMKVNTYIVTCLKRRIEGKEPLVRLSTTLADDCDDRVTQSVYIPADLNRKIKSYCVARDQQYSDYCFESLVGWYDFK